MGKIRVKTLGVEDIEKQEKKEAKKRQEAKKTAKAPGLHGGERVVAVGPTEEELKKLEETKQPVAPKEEPKKAKSPQKKVTKRTRSKKYKAVATLVDKNKTYSLQEALTLLPQLKIASFDETVELHINTTEAGILGQFTLPHGTGKQIRVAVADPSASFDDTPFDKSQGKQDKSSGQVDKLIEDIEKGKIDFDILIATPSAMPKLARVAKILGPKGLMPNPKNGTITQNPEETVKEFQKGQVHFKTETKLPLLHLAVGKMSFGEQKLTENISVAIKAIQPTRIKKVVLKSTMSPGLKVQI